MLRTGLVVLAMATALVQPASADEKILDNKVLKKVGKVKLEKRVLVNLVLAPDEDPDHDIMGEGRDLQVDNTEGRLVVHIGDGRWETQLESDYAKTVVRTFQFDEKVQRYHISQYNRKTPRSEWYPVQEVLINVDRASKQARLWARNQEEDDKELGEWYLVGNFGIFKVPTEEK